MCTNCADRIRESMEACASHTPRKIKREIAVEEEFDSGDEHEDRDGLLMGPLKKTLEAQKSDGIEASIQVAPKSSTGPISAPDFDDVDAVASPKPISFRVPFLLAILGAIIGVVSTNYGLVFMAHDAVKPYLERIGPTALAVVLVPLLFVLWWRWSTGLLARALTVFSTAVVVMMCGRQFFDCMIRFSVAIRS